MLFGISLPICSAAAPQKNIWQNVLKVSVTFLNFFMLYNSDDKCNSHTLTPHTHTHPAHLSPHTYTRTTHFPLHTYTHAHNSLPPPPPPPPPPTHTHTHSHICTNSHIHFSQLADDGDIYNSLPTHVPTNTTTQNSHTTSLIISSQWSEPPS